MWTAVVAPRACLPWRTQRPWKRLARPTARNVAKCATKSRSAAAGSSAQGRCTPALCLTEPWPRRSRCVFFTQLLPFCLFVPHPAPQHSAVCHVCSACTARGRAGRPYARSRGAARTSITQQDMQPSCTFQGRMQLVSASNRLVLISAGRLVDWLVLSFRC